jgi:flagellar basal body-associated protein FliL
MSVVDETTQNESGNAPAEQEAGNKKNLLVKIGIGTGIATVVGGTVWFVKKKFFSGKKEEEAAKQADGFENPDKK